MVVEDEGLSEGLVERRHHVGDQDDGQTSHPEEVELFAQQGLLPGDRDNLVFFTRVLDVSLVFPFSLRLILWVPV